MYFCANSSGVMPCALMRSILPLLSAPVCTVYGREPGWHSAIGNLTNLARHLLLEKSTL